MSISLVFGLVLLVSCASFQTKQFGLQDKDTIAINLTRDPNIALVLVTHVNGEATGAEISKGFLDLGGKTVFVNPIYVKLTGKPIILTVKCQVAVQTGVGMSLVYKSTELRLTRLLTLPLKKGDANKPLVTDLAQQKLIKILILLILQLRPQQLKLWV